MKSFTQQFFSVVLPSVIFIVNLCTAAGAPYLNVHVISGAPVNNVHVISGASSLVKVLHEYKRAPQTQGILRTSLRAATDNTILSK